MSSTQSEPPPHRSLSRCFRRRSKRLLKSAFKLLTTERQVEGALPAFPISKDQRQATSTPSSRLLLNEPYAFELEATPPRLPLPYSPSLIIEPNTVPELLELLPSPPPIPVRSVKRPRPYRSREKGILAESVGEGSDSAVTTKEDSEVSDGGWIGHPEPPPKLVRSPNVKVRRREGGKDGNGRQGSDKGVAQENDATEEAFGKLEGRSVTPKPPLIPARSLKRLRNVPSPPSPPAWLGEIEIPPGEECYELEAGYVEGNDQKRYGKSGEEGSRETQRRMARLRRIQGLEQMRTEMDGDNARGRGKPVVPKRSARRLRTGNAIEGQEMERGRRVEE